MGLATGHSDSSAGIACEIEQDFLLNYKIRKPDLMNISIPSLNQKWVQLFLPALTGGIVATAVVVMLASKNVGAIQLAPWQIAAIYVGLIAVSIRLGIKDIDNKDSATLKVAVNGVKN